MSLGGFEMELIRSNAALRLWIWSCDHRNNRIAAASIRFNADLFDAATIARMAGHFHTLLESVIRSQLPRSTIWIS